MDLSEILRVCTSDSILGVIRQESWILDQTFSLAWALRETAIVAMVLAPGKQHGVESRFLGHIELGQCRCLNRTQNFRLFNFVGQAVLEQQALAEVCRL